MKAKRLDGNLVVLNGDTFFPISMESMMLDHIKNSADVTLAIFRDKSWTLLRTMLGRQNEGAGRMRNFEQERRDLHFHVIL